MNYSRNLVVAVLRYWGYWCTGASGVLEYTFGMLFRCFFWDVGILEAFMC